MHTISIKNSKDHVPNYHGKHVLLMKHSYWKVRPSYYNMVQTNEDTQ